MYSDPIHTLHLAHATLEERYQAAEQARLRAYFKKDRRNPLHIATQKLGTLLIAIGTWLETSALAVEQPVVTEPR